MVLSGWSLVEYIENIVIYYFIYLPEAITQNSISGKPACQE